MAKRYDWLLKIVDQIQPETWAEIGVHNGHRAESVSRQCLQYRPEVTYWGYDLWELLVDHESVFNGKGDSTRLAVEQRLQRLRSRPGCQGFRYSLIQGDHEDTVPTGFEVDLVFIDGDHRRSSIRRDYRRTQSSQTVVFDDWYDPEIPEVGCNDVKWGSDCRAFLIPSEDTERFTGSRVCLLVVTKNPQLTEWLNNQESVRRL